MVDEGNANVLGDVVEEITNDPIEKGYSNACKDKNFINNVLNNENDQTAKAYKDFADEIDKHVDHTNDSNESNEHIDDSTESDKRRIVKQMIDLSIVRENGKLIHSSETIPLNSLLVNAIGATIGNCPKNGDEFKFNLKIEEDGSVNLQLHAPNNKMNNGIILSLFNNVLDENKMNENVMSFIRMISTKFGASFRPYSSSDGYSNGKGRDNWSGVHY